MSITLTLNDPTVPMNYDINTKLYNDTSINILSSDLTAWWNEHTNNVSIKWENKGIIQFQLRSSNKKINISTKLSGTNKILINKMY
jgi:hypothetical protein